MRSGKQELESGEMDPVEMCVLMMFGLIVAGSVLTVSTWERVVDWLVTRELLVSAADHPLLRIPAADGAGLDARRLLVAAAALLLAVVLLVGTARAKAAIVGGGR